MDLRAFGDLVEAMPGVRRRSQNGLARWQYDGRLVARALDDTHVVIRAPFDVRDLLLGQHPDVFSVPARFTRHMMVVADLSVDDDAVVDALTSAWRHQSEGDQDS